MDPAALADKMHAVITDDAWNGRQPYSCVWQLAIALQRLLSLF